MNQQHQTRGILAGAAARLLLLLAFYAPAILPAVARTPVKTDAKLIVVVFRYDDYSSVSATDLELKFLAALHEHRQPCTFSVVPVICAGNVHDQKTQKLLPLTPAKAKILKDELHDGLLEVAQHGYSHQALMRKGRYYSEFAGRDYAEQLKRIREGKARLEQAVGVPVHTFIPPWGHYDANTLKALEQTGFSTISAGPYGLQDKDSRLFYLPETCTLTQLKKSIAKARRGQDALPVIVVLFHEYDFKENDRRQGILTLQDFSGLTDWLAQQPDVEVMSIHEVNEIMADGLPRKTMK